MDNNTVKGRTETEVALTELLDRLRNAYGRRNDYPPFALTAWDDRRQYFDYLTKLANEIIEEAKALAIQEDV